MTPPQENTANVHPAHECIQAAIKTTHMLYYTAEDKHYKKSMLRNAALSTFSGLICLGVVAGTDNTALQLERGDPGFSFARGMESLDKINNSALLSRAFGFASFCTGIMAAYAFAKRKDLQEEAEEYGFRRTKVGLFIPKVR